MGDSIVEGQTQQSNYFWLALLLLACNLISAGLFISRVHHLAYDDVYNTLDVHNYAVKGFSRAALASHKNAPGPLGYAWMTAAVRIIGQDELRDARIGALFSWVLIGVGILVGARFSRCPQLWYGALIVLLVFPHAVEAAGEVLTEGPAFFFAMLGALAWTEFVARASSGTTTLALGMLGCLFLGLSATCRQYNIALLPAAALIAVWQLYSRSWAPGEKWRWSAGALFSLLLAALPVLLLVLAWKGITSPGIKSGASYNMAYHAAAGLNLTRPLIVALYVAFYLMPFTFPLMARLKSEFRLPSVAFAVLAGIAAGYWSSSLIQPGPLQSALNAASKFVHSRAVLFGLLAVVAVYNLLALAFALWQHGDTVKSSPAVMFACCVILFFVFEQFGVGGTIPFFDRYVIETAPFIGVLTFALLPNLGRVRFSVLALLSVLSHVMLWRYAFTP